MKHLTIVLLALGIHSVVAQPRCLLSREPCHYPDEAKRPTENTYNFHRTKLVGETGRCEISSGKKRDPVPIADYMTSMRILESPTFSMGRYKTRWRVEYNVKCDEGSELIYFHLISLDTRGKECAGRCWDYLELDRGSYGTNEECGQKFSENALAQLESDGNLTIVFRTGERTNRNDGKWVLRKGFKLYSICFKPIVQSTRRESRDAGRITYSSLFPDLYDSNLELSKDLAKFHRKWQKMSKRPDAELVVEHIAYDHTINYVDNTIVILNASNGIVATYNKVNVLATFDSTGAIKYHLHGVRGREKPHFTETGPLVIVCNCAFFQMFVTDPRGLVPNEREQVQLRAMYAPFLNLPVHDEETYDRIFNQIYSGDDTVPLEDLPQSPMFTEVAREAVIAAHRNAEACNPVLRAQSNATLQFYSQLNDTLVMSLKNLFCSLIFDDMYYVFCDVLMEWEKITCQINQESAMICDPLKGFIFLASTTPVEVTVTVTYATRQMEKVVLCSG